MKIVHVAAGNAYGGIERMLVALAGADQPGITQHYAVSFAGRLEQELRAQGADVHRLPASRASRPLMIWRARRAFASVLAQLSPDVAVFHSAWPHAMFAPVARAGGARVAFWQHQPISRPAWPDRWARSVTPDVLVFNSAFTQESPAFPEPAGAVIHPPVPRPMTVDEGTRRELRRSLDAADEDVVVLMAARLERWKGQDVLLEAARLVDPAARLRFWIAGGAHASVHGAFGERLRRLAGVAELRKRVRLLGERDDVPALMGAADVYCQPNLRAEPFGVAIAEAMLAGLPCVVSAGGGAAELVDERSAVMARAGDPEAIARALETLALAPELRARMGRHASARAARMTDPAGRLSDLVTALSAAAA
jgi:glycosyltransferase involved in cell wall biosynthesis